MFCRVRQGIWAGIFAGLLLPACCNLGPSKEIVARRQRCEGQGLPLGDGKCHQCPAGTRLQAEIRVFRQEPDDWPWESNLRAMTNDTGHGRPWGGRGRSSGGGSGRLFEESTYEDRAVCKDAQGRLHGPSGKWILNGSESKATLHAWGYYKQGLRDGLWEEEGLQAKGTYVAGKREGRWTMFDGGGEYRAGLREGPWKSNLGEGSYRKGKRHGPWRVEPARLLLFEGKASGSYEDGQARGKWTLTLKPGECSGEVAPDGSGEGFHAVGLWVCRMPTGTQTHCLDREGKFVWDDYEGKRRDCTS